MKTNNSYQKQDNEESSHRGAAETRGRRPDSPNDGRKFGLDAPALKQHLIDILEHSADFIGSARVEDGALLYHNRAAKRMIGLPEEADLSGMTVADMHPAWAARQVLEVAIPSLLEHGVWSCESALLHRDGREIPVHQTLVLHRDADGKPLYHSTIMKDITERKRFEAKLAERERDFRSLAENLPDNIARFDRDGRYLYVNPTHARTLGRPREELVGMPIPDSHTSVKSAVARIAATGQAIQSVRQPVVVAGIPQLHDVSLVPEFDENGIVVSVLGIGRDMTDFYGLQDALAAREQEFRSLAESSPDHIFRCDQEGRILYLNTTLIDYLGLADAEEVIGKRPEEVWTNGRFDSIQQATAEAVATGAVTTVEVSRRFDSGELHFYQVRIVPERDTAGRIVGTLAFGRDITAIRTAEHRLARFVDSLPGMAFAFRLAPDGRASFPFTSSAIREIFGLEPDDVKDDFMPIHRLAHPEDQPRIEAVIAESAWTLAPFRVETRVCRPGQPERWLEVRSVPEREADGSIVWTGLMLDISERKHMEEALHSSEYRWKFALEGSGQGVWDWNLETASVDFSPRYKAMLGYREEEFPSRLEEWQSRVHPDDIAAALEAHRQHFEGQTPGYEAEFRMRCKDGSWKWVLSRGMVVDRDPTGKPLRIIGTHTDISERKRIEKALAEREREFRSLAENLPDPVFRYDRECRRIYVNPAVRELTGVPPEALLGKTPSEMPVVGIAERSRIQATIQRVIASGEKDDVEIRMVATDGRERWYRMVQVPEFAPDGSVRGVLSIGRDETKLHQLEVELRRRAALEEQISSLAQAAPGFLFLGRIEPDGRAHFPFASDGVVELFGLRPEDIRDDAEVLRSRYHPDDRMRLADCMAESALNLTSYRIEIRVRHPEKGERWIEIRGTPRRKDDGATEWHGLMFDITERKQAEAELHAQYEQILLLNERLEENARSLEEQAVELEASQEQLKFTEAWYRGILHSAPDGMMVINERGLVTQVNAQLARMFGYSEGELIGQPMAMLIPPDAGGEDLDKRIGFALDLPEDRHPKAAGELRGRCRDGSEIAIDVTFSRLPEADMAGTICVAIRDITERKRMQAALAEREREFRTLVENSPDTVARYGRNLKRQYVNPAFAALVEGGGAALIGRRPTECPGGPNTPLYEQNIADVFETAQPREFELKWADKNGREFCSLINLTPEFGEDSTVQSVLAVGRDISELNVFRQKIHQMAFYDPLTALPNRALFNDRLHQMITDASWHGQLAGVMMIDMDRFKAVNDTMGHAVGDELLRETASRLGDCVRAYDTVARLGGDEFAILLPEIRRSDDLGRIASKVLAKFDERFLLEGKEVFVSCSIGIALYPNDSTDANDLVKFADSAMYFAKRSGRNNFRFYSKDLTASAKERLTLESELRRAVERQELELHYQPKVSLHDGMIIGSEALLRWRHPRLGMVPPNQFIQIAEDTGLIVDLGKWVLREACRTASEWNAGVGPRHKMAINLSARQFQSHDLTATVADVLAETACRPEWIELEITESLLLDPAGQTLDMLLALRAMGITIAIDDFGTGYSALSYLTSFPIDTLKIDRSFIHSVATDNYRAELVKAILSIARCLGQQVVAEGVETLEQAAFLQAHGCQVVQGFLYSKPLPKHEVAALPRHFDCR